MAYGDPFSPDWLRPCVWARAPGDGYPGRSYCGATTSSEPKRPPWVWPAAVRDQPVCKKCLVALTAYVTR